MHDFSKGAGLMNQNRIATLLASTTLAAALMLLSGCNEVATDAQASPRGFSAPRSTLLSGTQIDVVLGSQISSKTAGVGDGWHGTVQEGVALQNGGMIPAGSQVDGVVTGVIPAKRGLRAMLDLGIRHINVNGRSEAITASTESVIAGSPRARNLGAIAGGAVAGALIGKMVGDGKNAAVGALIGGGAATAVVATSDGYQVVLKSGTVMTFTVNQAVAMR
jgi:hypothetical protein